MTRQRTGDQASGRRLRKWEATRATITQAARDAFFGKPFETVTVQQIADRADVAVGTLFYHASSKAELFFMVFNTVLEQAIAEGEAAEEAMAADADVTERIAVLVAPVNALRDSGYATNMTRYHRDLLFSDSNEPHRRDGIMLVRRLEARIAQILSEVRGLGSASEAGWAAARAIFAVLHFDIAVPGRAENPQPGAAHPGEPGLRTQINLIVSGFIALTGSEASPGGVPKALKAETN